MRNVISTLPPSRLQEAAADAITAALDAAAAKSRPARRAAARPAARAQWDETPADAEFWAQQLTICQQQRAAERQRRAATRQRIIARHRESLYV